MEAPSSSNEAADTAAPPAAHTCTDNVLDSILARILQSVDGSNARGGKRWRFLAEPLREALRQLDKRKKLELLFTLDELWQDLLSAPPQEVQALADCRFFRMLCLNLHDPNPVAFARTVEGLSHCIKLLPELVIKAWAYGAVRPVAAVILEHRTLADVPNLITDLRLQHALYFLTNTGGLLATKGCTEEAQKTSKKCFNWFLRQGVIARVAEIWVALSKAGRKLEKDDKLFVMVYKVAATLMYASHFANVLKGPTDLRLQTAGLVGATFRLIQLQRKGQPPPGVNDFRQTAVGICASLLLINWLHFTDPDSEVRKRGKKEIVEHPDVLKVLRILQQLVESPDQATARNARDSFVALVRLLICEHARPLPDGFVETAFRFMGDPSIKESAGYWMFVMARSFRAGTLSADFLLAHFFPGFLRAFAAEAHRRKPARVYTPELESLVDMVSLLHDCLWFSTPPGMPKRTETPPYGQVAIPPKLLPKFLDMMLASGAVAAVASLAGSAWYRFAGKVCLGVANVAASGSQTKLRRYHEQIIPALMRTILDGYQDDEVVRFFRMGLLPYCTNEVAPSMPVFQLAIAQKSATNEVVVSYDWGKNIVYIEGEGSRENMKMLEQIVLDLEPRSLEAADIVKDEVKRLALYYKHRQVVLNEGPAGESVQELLIAQHPGERCPVCKRVLGSVKPRCSRCRATNYCSVACQKKDWPEHKNICKKSQ